MFTKIKGLMREISARRKKKATRNKLAKIGHELKVNPPKILAHTRRKFGVEDARKQRVAILLSKARRSGADV